MPTLKQDLGKFGELLACKYLKEKGYKIIDKNYYTRGGEIDIIAQDDKILVFIEVKTRTNRAFGLPEEAVDFRKQQKIAKTAECYLARYRLYEQNYRIDSIAVEVDQQNRKAKIRHEKDVVGF